MFFTASKPRDYELAMASLNQLRKLILAEKDRLSVKVQGIGFTTAYDA